MARRSRRRRRRGSSNVVRNVVLVALVAAALVTGQRWYSHRGSSAQAAPASTTPTGTAQAASNPFALAVPVQQTRGACIDSTSSVPYSFATGVRDSISAALRGFAPSMSPLPNQAPAPGSPIAESQSPLELTIREVFTNSGSTDLLKYTQTVSVPGVRGLTGAQPSVTATDFDVANANWRAAYKDTTDDRAAAARAAKDASKSIAALPLINDPNNNSGIVACMSTLLQTTSPSGNSGYLIASDLQDNSNVQVVGDFKGSPLLVVQVCRSGDLDTCKGYLDHFTQYMKKLHVGKITVIRPEDMGSAVTKWVRVGHV